MRQETLRQIDSLVANLSTVSEYHDVNPEQEGVPDDAVAHIVAEPETDATYWEELGFSIKRIEGDIEFWILEVNKEFEHDFTSSRHSEDRQRLEIPKISVGDSIRARLHARSMSLDKPPAKEIRGEVTEYTHFNGSTDIDIDTEQFGKLRLSQVFLNEWCHDVSEPIGHSRATGDQFRQIAEWDKIGLLDEG